MKFKKPKSGDEIFSLLAKGVEMTGEICFTGSLRIDGIVKGKVHSEAILVIGPEGKVEADVNVRRVCINGEFRGIIHASDRVEIRKDGQVYGDIYTPCLILEAGALFEGRCSMSDSKTLGQNEGAAERQAPGP